MLSLKEVKVQLIDKAADGIKICRIDGESLVTVVIPRDLLERAQTLPELPSRGVYYLLDEDHGVISRVYAGQTVKGFHRFADHKSKRAWWNVAIVHLDTAHQFDKEFLDMLEAELINYIRVNGDYEAENSNTPQVTINPYKEERIHDVHENIVFRMKVLGYDLNRHYGSDGLEHKIFKIRSNKARAKGTFDTKTGKFTVLSGSEVLCGSPIIKNNAATDRRLECFGDSKQTEITHTDIVFSSPSAASVFVLGGSKNGWIEWVDEDGKTLDELYRHRVS